MVHSWQLDAMDADVCCIERTVLSDEIDKPGEVAVAMAMAMA